MPRLPTLTLLTLALVSCSTPRSRGLRLANARAAELKALSTYPPSWCRVDAHLTQPAIARYREMFPKEVDLLTAESLPYTWKATESTCEVTPLKRSPLLDNYRGFLETAFCVLLQTHFVNSPFDGLAIDGAHVDVHEGRPLLRTGDARDLGLYLDQDRFAVETRTKGQGVLSAEYGLIEERRLPTRIARRLGATTFELSDLTYPPAADGRPRAPKAFAIRVGEERAALHSQVQTSECRGL